MTYQSFDGERGDSKSASKLQRIQMPDDLSEKDVLDIGCNEGFFCKAAMDRGAKRVVGIDTNKAVIEKAKERVPGGEFHACSWWDIPVGKFDLILFLSAIHYEPDQRRLTNSLVTRIKPGGFLILECGVKNDLLGKEWYVAQRHDGMLKYPTTRLLIEDILEDYAVRDIGRSVDQPGDPIPRFVFHCMPWIPTLFVIGGASKSGKSGFASQFGRRGMRVLYTDFLLGTLHSNRAELKSPFVTYLQETMEQHQIAAFVRKVMEDKRADDLCAMLLRFVSHCDRMTIIEGYAFSFPEIQEAMKRQASKAGYRTVFSVL